MLLRDPLIIENMLFAIIELYTSLTILISPLAIYYISYASFEWLIRRTDNAVTLNITIAIVISLLLLILPIVVSYCVLTPRIGFQFSMIIDYRIYFSLICKHKSGMKDLVTARRNILFVTLFKSALVTTVVIPPYYDEKFPYFCDNCRYITVLLFWWGIINGIFTIMEITNILRTNISFLNWVFLSSLKERTFASNDSIDNETGDNQIPEEHK